MKHLHVHVHRRAARDEIGDKVRIQLKSGRWVITGTGGNYLGSHPTLEAAKRSAETNAWVVVEVLDRVRDADYSRMDKGELSEAYNRAIGAGKQSEAKAIRAEQERRASSTTATFSRRTGRTGDAGEPRINIEKDRTGFAYSFTFEGRSRTDGGFSTEPAARSAAHNFLTYLKGAGKTGDAPVGHAAWRGKPKVTLANAKSQLSALGVTLKFDGDDYIVNLKGAGEASAYYTDDLDDALGTGIYMANRARTGAGDATPKEELQRRLDRLNENLSQLRQWSGNETEIARLRHAIEEVTAQIALTRDTAGEKRWTGGAMTDAAEAALLGEETDPVADRLAYEDELLGAKVWTGEKGAAS